MAKTSTVVVSLVLAVLVVLGALALVYGPGLYREGKAFVGPIVELSQAEEKLAALDAGMPFQPPADGVVPADRFAVFLEVLRELMPRYQKWHDLEQQLDSSGQEDWQTAKEVLAMVREVAAAQRAALTGHGMSPAEFNWIEDRVYSDWAGRTAASAGELAADEALRRAAAEDLEALDDLEARYGASAATRELRRRFEARRAGPGDGEVGCPEGVPEANCRLFWEHRDEIAGLDLGRASDLHDMLRKRGNVEIRVGEGE